MTVNTKFRQNPCFNGDGDSSRGLPGRDTVETAWSCETLVS